MLVLRVTSVISARGRQVGKLGDVGQSRCECAPLPGMGQDAVTLHVCVAKETEDLEGKAE